MSESKDAGFGSDVEQEVKELKADDAQQMAQQMSESKDAGFGFDVEQEVKELKADCCGFYRCLAKFLGGCAYWRAIRKQGGCRPPVLTLCAVVACVLVFLLVEDHGWSYVPGPDQPWYLAPAAMVSHVDASHLTQNVCSIVLLGGFLEATEGTHKVLVIMWGGGVLGAALNGVINPDVNVRGISGAIYATMWSQLALLALNWSEMPLRWLRLFLCALLLVVDVTTFFTAERSNVSFGAHGFGALAGLCICLAIGRNVRLRRFEVTLVLLGSLGYPALVAVALAGEQRWASALGAAPIPVVVGYAIATTHRVCRTNDAEQDGAEDAAALAPAGAPPPRKRSPGEEELLA